ncbi:Cytochrome P450 85A [Vitis vinifera]|uniref:Cytochrome P450 85A n=1 Tax=Vitis vinifera TaxID=29760 RepID=A0A438J169_VITVI|nr:Cytochrome P450 85A [Vitis vinifera]
MDPGVNRYILLNEGKGLVPGYPPSMRNIIGNKNIAAVHGATHKYIRGSLLSLIGPPVIKDHLLQQVDGLMRSFLHNWCRDPSLWETRGTHLTVTRGTHHHPDHHHPDSPKDIHKAVLLSRPPQGKAKDVSASPDSRKNKRRWQSMEIRTTFIMHPLHNTSDNQHVSSGYNRPDDQLK